MGDIGEAGTLDLERKDTFLTCFASETLNCLSLSQLPIEVSSATSDCRAGRQAHIDAPHRWRPIKTRMEPDKLLKSHIWNVTGNRSGDMATSIARAARPQHG